jgi:hypothetical protein
MDVIDQSAEDIFDDVPDFHRQVKARLLKLGHTSQLIRETTLAPDKFLNRAGLSEARVAGPGHGRVESCDGVLLQDPAGTAVEVGTRQAGRLLHRACV